MSENFPGKVEMSNMETCAEWPEQVKQGFSMLVQIGDACDFSVLCAVGLNRESKRVSVSFGPHASQNPHLAMLCDDVAEMFQAMARRLRQ